MTAWFTLLRVPDVLGVLNHTDMRFFLEIYIRMTYHGNIEQLNNHVFPLTCHLIEEHKVTHPEFQD